MACEVMWEHVWTCEGVRECASVGEVVLGRVRVNEGVRGHEKACKCV